MKCRYRNYCEAICGDDEISGLLLYELLFLTKQNEKYGGMSWIIIPDENILENYGVVDEDYEAAFKVLMDMMLIAVTHIGELRRRKVGIRLNFLLTGVTGLIDDLYFEGVFFGSHFLNFYYHADCKPKLSTNTIKELTAINWECALSIDELVPVPLVSKDVDQTDAEGGR